MLALAWGNDAPDDGPSPTVTWSVTPEAAEVFAGPSPHVTGLPATLVPAGTALSARVVRAARTDPWCLVVVDWALPEGSVRTSGGGQSDDAPTACRAALQSAADDLVAQIAPDVGRDPAAPPVAAVSAPQATLAPPPDPAAPLPPPPPIVDTDTPPLIVQDRPSRGEQWMVRGGYVVGAGFTLVMVAGFTDGDFRQTLVLAGSSAMLVGTTMAGAGLAMGFDEPAKVRFGPRFTQRGGPGLGLRARLGRRRR